MKKEPVAELVLEQMAVGDASSLRVNWLTDSYPPAGTKLYTHPVELTDEEILKLEEIEFDNYCVDKESKGRKTATITDPEWAIWFAKAILRKAQEK